MMKISVISSSDITDKNLVIFYDAKKQVSIPAKLAESNKHLKDYLSNFLKNFLKEEPSSKKSKEADKVFDIFDQQLSNKARKILFVGCGKAPTNNDIALWVVKLGARVAKNLLKQNTKEFYVVLPEFITKPSLVGSFLEGLYLGGYTFEHYFTSERRKAKIENIFLIASNFENKKELEYSFELAESVKMARDVANLAANDFTPKDFKDKSQELSKKHNFIFKCLDESDFKKLGFGCYNAVAKGSEQKAYLSIMEYKHPQAKTTFAIVGKGLTFDTGGYSLKPSQSMEEMKFDMCGGAAVLAAMNMIGHLKPKFNVIGLIAAAENMISGKAYKPGDIFTAYNKKTVEIINTDAEGRLVLADTLAYAEDKYKPTYMIDLATLTGACLVALGRNYSGAFTNNKNLLEKLKLSATKVGEEIWELPIGEHFQEELKSSYADIKHTGSRYGGASNSAKFLENFVGEVPWVHLDIAGSAWDVSNIDFYPEKGATGVGVRLLSDFFKNWKD